ncbi:two-component system, OmpR family, sensor histidine kinase BaeS [Burkholderia sp. WP9]|uniref:ATP-binding protein n=1 Tax=Burkholderia sp. WP9 TaxID=1500263 RepID=UPI0008971E30|nr:ATP-binding protein [Burkholderia sp. WP9]SEF05810.1 two-component system, OmpR family, sensor histidine kinase BaeS [Burkholderia sp. WP9]
MRFGITWKMFLAVLIACLAISLTMGYALRVSFENGFLHYVRERNAGRIKAVMAKVTSEYAAHGNWSFLREHPEAWLALLDEAAHDALREELATAQTGKLPGWRTFPGSGSVQQLLGPLSGPSEGPHWGMRLPPAPPSGPDIAMERDRVSASGVAGGDSRYDRPPPSAPLASSPVSPPSHDGMTRDTPPEGPPVTLYDARHELVASTGEPPPPPGSTMRPVVYAGKVVGWLAVNGPDTLSDAADIAFQAQQKRATWEIAGVAIVLAALVALVLARIVLAPVKRLMNATHRLAGGDYTARVPAGRRDELGRLAGDFNVLADSLQKAERSRRDFIADISHELRTPLAVLRGELEAIEDGVHVFNRDSLTSLQTEVNMLNKLIEDLYELSLSDVGALSYRKTPTQVGRLARASIEAMRESFKAKRIELDLTCMQDIADTTFAVDPARFVQLLKNLLQNSLRYTDPDGHVRVSLSQSAVGWQLDVQDSLPGVPEVALAQLFDRFYRVDESRSRQNGGAGLGLALCHAIVTAHGGTIRAKASPMGGVWITASFPSEGDVTT